MSLISPELFAATTYDYIVAGGGTAGLTLAARLTENPRVSVAVLEAGEDRSGELPVNAWGLTATMLGDPRYDWAFQTTPQEDADDRIIPWPRGRQLGGSSGLNYWYWNRPSQDDIDNWAELGNEGWTWDSLLPYYLKSETYNDPPEEQARDLNITYVDPTVHGTAGPIEASFPPSYGSLGRAWSPTFQNLDLSVDGDPYGGRATGGYCTLLSQNLRNVSRSYAATAYFKPNAGRPNLKVLTGALVNHVVFADRQGRGAPLVATGVNFTSGNRTYEVKAKREVILSAGVTQSPQLLELSGIGGGELLRSLGIDVLLDNPSVGENLQDHPFTSLSFEVADGVPTLDVLRDPAVLERSIESYRANRTGPLGQATCSTSYLSYPQMLRSSNRTRPRLAPERADNKTNVLSLAKQHEILLRKLGDAQEPFAQELYNPVAMSMPAPTSGSYVTLLGLLSHPFSRGSIHINSSDPTAPPVIDPRFLSDPIDLDVLATIAFHLQTVATTQPFASLLKDNGTVYAPGNMFLTEDNVRQHVRATLGELQHPTGTCAMGPRGQGGVVDAKLIVHGTRNLRVVDASVIPIQPVGTIQALVYALAERAADIIKGVDHANGTSTTTSNGTSTSNFSGAATAPLSALAVLTGIFALVASVVL